MSTKVNRITLLLAREVTLIEVLQKRDSWMAVLKPSGMSVHNESGRDLISLLKEQLGVDSVHLINRLDAPVAGIVLIGLEEKVSRQLHDLFAQRKVEKTYLAVGVLKGSSHSFVSGDRGQWTWSLTKKAESRKNPRGWGPKRVPCTTEWLVENVTDDLVYLKLQPHTGRKHQLRRHCAIAGAPLLGDHRYGPADRDDIALYSWKLVFECPVTGDNINLSAPMPDWFTPPE